MTKRAPTTATFAFDGLPCVHPNAAGLDIGVDEIYVCVPSDRDPHPVRAFATFTADLHALADWLVQCGIDTVAIESTGIFWIPIYELLEARGMRMCLVNPQQSKIPRGRKSDFSTASGCSGCIPSGCWTPGFVPMRNWRSCAPICGIAPTSSSIARRIFNISRKRWHSTISIPSRSPRVMHRLSSSIPHCRHGMCQKPRARSEQHYHPPSPTRRARTSHPIALVQNCCGLWGSIWWQ
jgi:hypothetical protein